MCCTTKAAGARWIYDIAAFLIRYGDSIDWNLLTQKAIAFRLVFSIQTVLAQLEDDWQVPFPPAVLELVAGLPLSAEEKSVVRRMTAEQRPVVQRFWTDLVGMSGWRGKAAIPDCQPLSIASLHA